MKTVRRGSARRPSRLVGLVTVTPIANTPTPMCAIVMPSDPAVSDCFLRNRCATVRSSAERMNHAPSGQADHLPSDRLRTHRGTMQRDRDRGAEQHAEGLLLCPWRFGSPHRVHADAMRTMQRHRRTRKTIRIRRADGDLADAASRHRAAASACRTQDQPRRRPAARCSRSRNVSRESSSKPPLDVSSARATHTARASRRCTMPRKARMNRPRSDRSRTRARDTSTPERPGRCQAGSARTR